MDMYPDPTRATSEPVPAHGGREARSRRRVLATSVAVAGPTAPGGS